MTGGTEAVQGIAALAFGGFLFIVVGSALSASTTADPVINLTFWGVIYIIAAVVLAVGVVYAAVVSILQ